MAKCPAGKIKRKPFTRKAFTRKAFTNKNGVKVKRTRIPKTRIGATCIPDKGLKGKTPKNRRLLPQPRPGGLRKYGYSSRESPLLRHQALLKAVRNEGYRKIQGRLTLISNFTKRSNPRLHRVLRSDINWMMKNVKPKYTADKNIIAKKRRSIFILS